MGEQTKASFKGRPGPGGAGAGAGAGSLMASAVGLPAQPDHVMRSDLEGKYSPEELIGSGAYGSVWRARAVSEANKSSVYAIKKIRHKKDTLYCLKRSLREIKILRHFRHGNIVCLHDVIASASGNESSLYLVLDLMECDLHKIIQSPQPLTLDHCRWFLYQLLRALKYLHSANVVHRDIKPSNLLVNSDCLLKLADFGMARCLNDTASDASKNSSESANGEGGKMPDKTVYVATRWYRSPELILCHAEYSTAIDMWSVGCILGELINRKPMFPGKSQVGQLELICNLLGNPGKSFIENIKSDTIKSYVCSLPENKARTPFVAKFPLGTSREALDLMQRLLIWEPKRRLHSEIALSHSFFKPHHNPAEEPICCTDFDFSFESSLKTTEDMNLAINEEIEKINAKKKAKSKFDVKRGSPGVNPLESFYKQYMSQKMGTTKEDNESGKIEPQFIPEDDDASFEDVKKQHSQAVKAQLRAAILSGDWRKNIKRKTRTGRPRNTTNTTSTKVSKKAKTDIAISCNKKFTPVLKKDELGLVAQVSDFRPVTVKIVTKPNASGSNTNLVTVTLLQPKKVLPKSTLIPVPSLSHGKKAVPGIHKTRQNEISSVLKARDSNEDSNPSTNESESKFDSFKEESKQNFLPISASACIPRVSNTVTSSHLQIPASTSSSSIASVTKPQFLPSINEVYPPLQQRLNPTPDPPPTQVAYQKAVVDKPLNAIVNKTPNILQDTFLPISKETSCHPGIISESVSFSASSALSKQQRPMNGISGQFNQSTINKINEISLAALSCANRMRVNTSGGGGGGGGGDQTMHSAASSSASTIPGGEDEATQGGKLLDEMDYLAAKLSSSSLHTDSINPFAEFLNSGFTPNIHRLEGDDRLESPLPSMIISPLVSASASQPPHNPDPHQPQPQPPHPIPDCHNNLQHQQPSNDPSLAQNLPQGSDSLICDTSNHALLTDEDLRLALPSGAVGGVGPTGAGQGQGPGLPSANFNISSADMEAIELELQRDLADYDFGRLLGLLESPTA